ncbi:WapI family immunity protein [Bacillus cereus]|uniref:PadR family transcriptional regulator n=1 Tax=Bacillus cereus TaxID=1396 RepID=A0A2B1JZU7_BACCE|nr:PadR family transcriptional regulator [Bacillus cereus]PFN19764.1 PadR family transcriptional regulator [Bacillus cereus]
MIFQNEKVSLQLDVVKYEFENAHIACDRNWLMVKAKLSEENKVFETMDPFLQTSDLQDMRKWFQSLPNPTYNELGFIEPNLVFEFIGEKGGEFHIIIRLSLELKPSWCKQEVYEFSIGITRDDKDHIIRSLEEQQRKYPTR